MDVGTASGFLTFEMEKRGASVVSFEVASARLMQIDPNHRNPHSREELIDAQEPMLEGLKNAYWYCHRHLGSSAKGYYGNVLDLPPALGPFDVVVAGMCLPHMRDPLGALQSVAAKALDTVIITQQTLPEERPIMEMGLNPGLDYVQHAWWMISDGCITRFMALLGFVLETHYRRICLCTAFQPPRYDDCATFVFRRGRA